MLIACRANEIRFIHSPHLNRTEFRCSDIQYLWNNWTRYLCGTLQRRLPKLVVENDDTPECGTSSRLKIHLVNDPEEITIPRTPSSRCVIRHSGSFPHIARLEVDQN